MFRRLRPLLILLVAAVALAGCYLPARFDAEIELDRRGYYKVIFAGYMVDTRLYKDLKEGKVQGAQEVEEVKKLKADIERDPDASDFGYIKQGYFKLKWQREGDLLKAKSVTFLRRNEHILGIAYNKETRLVNILGRSLPKSQKDQIVQAGMNTTGELRVITDTKVISHNADEVKDFPARGPRTKVYVFRIPNIYRATPQMQVSLR
ncbi:MAG: hypothetical protein COW30_07145 [Rhodospirillales bacterium CG15_BIG_FIL_POST_REV_8_21_14_020_66_15]|nr:MAG: hypothetical protein COW30_07145 [Rhodospirillales bacterium CG15_BIG_FIL_POST_REV_8_21_14_020_66_15]